MKLLKVKVDKIHIDFGLTTCTNCPMALALQDQGVEDASVTTEVVAYGQVWELSQAAKKFIEDFDKGVKVIPTTFNLELTLPTFEF